MFGSEHDVDTDGDSSVRDATDWTELYVVSRQNKLLQLEIEPVDLQPLTLRISATTVQLLEAASSFLLDKAGGQLAD